jgi:hypothetical protein
MRRSTSIAAALLVGSAVVAPVTLAALDTRISELRTIGRTVRAAVDVRDMFPENLRSVVQSGSALHVRVQAELWEDRPMWDRLVRPAVVTVFRIVRDPTTAQIAVSDAVGQVASFATYPEMVPLRVDVGPADAVSDGSRYYLRLMTTIGTIAEREIESTGDAVFGRDESTVSIASVGKLLFRTVLQITDYLQSVSAEARSRVFEGRELNSGVR